MAGFEKRLSDVECKIHTMEVDAGKMTILIDTLINRMDNLSKWIMALVITLIPCVLTGISILIKEALR